MLIPAGEVDWELVRHRPDLSGTDIVAGLDPQRRRRGAITAAMGGAMRRIPGTPLRDAHRSRFPCNSKSDMPIGLNPLSFAVIACIVLSGCVPGLRPFHTSPPRREADRRQAMQYFIRAKTYEAQGNYLGAIVTLRNAADLDPTPTICTRLAMDYQQVGDLRMAVKFARRGLRLDPARGELRHLLVQLLEGSGDPAGAAVELRKLLGQESADWRVYRHLAYLYMETGQTARVAPLFRQLLARGDTPAQVQADLAGVLMRIGQSEPAEAIYRRLIRETPQVEDAWLGLADLLLAQGRRDEALALYREAMKALNDSVSPAYHLARLIAGDHDLEAIIEQESPEFLYRLGVALSEAEKYDQAAKVFEAIVGMRPGTVEGWLDLARHYVYLEAYDEAESVLKRATTAMPDSTDLYLFWGTALERAGRDSAAVAVYRKALERDTDHAQLYLFWGLAHEERGDWDQARNVYGLALTQFPDSALFCVRQGMALAREHRWDAAIKRYREALNVDPGSAEGQLHWGLALQHLKRWDEAIAHLRQAAALDTAATQILFLLGAALEQAASDTGNQVYFEQATVAFERLLDLNPADAFALNYLGYMYADSGTHLDEAVSLLRRAVSLDPDNGAFLDSLGWAYYQLGDLRLAWDYVERAIAGMDADFQPEEQAVIHAHAGDIAHAQGHVDGARAHWAAALELQPDSPELRRKLQALEGGAE